MSLKDIRERMQVQEQSLAGGACPRCGDTVGSCGLCHECYSPCPRCEDIQFQGVSRDGLRSLSLDLIRNQLTEAIAQETLEANRYKILSRGLSERWRTAAATRSSQSLVHNLNFAAGEVFSMSQIAFKKKEKLQQIFQNLFPGEVIPQ